MYIYIERYIYDSVLAGFHFKSAAAAGHYLQCQIARLADPAVCLATLCGVDW